MNNTISVRDPTIRGPSASLKRPLVHEKLNPVFQWLHADPDFVNRNANTMAGKTSGVILLLSKAIWPLTPFLQTLGLVNKNFQKAASAFYGSVWSIVYSCYRPWRPNRELLVDPVKGQKIPEFVKGFYKLNEHFRLGMGSLVSLVYGGGAFGMLLGMLKRDDDFYSKAQKIYQMGMFNQNQIFASMDLSVWLRRKFNPEKIEEVDKPNNNYKARIEQVNSISFLPQIITRAIGSLELFGVELNDSLNRVVKTVDYFGYGLWASRFGIMKKSSEKGGDLPVLTEGLDSKTQKFEEMLINAQKYGSEAFSTVLPGLSWISAIGEAFGYSDFAKTTFKLEGILERLLPTIPAWCIHGTWFKKYVDHLKNPNVQHSIK